MSGFVGVVIAIQIHGIYDTMLMVAKKSDTLNLPKMQFYTFLSNTIIQVMF